MSDQTPDPKKSIFDRLPSFVWIIIFILGIVALIGGVMGLFVGLSSVEGFASILLLVIAWIVLRAGGSNVAQARSPGDSIATAIGVTFFALMGMAIDQPGNYLYNLPLQVFFCPAGSQVTRDINVTHSKPGSTEVSQLFACEEPREHTFVKEVGVLQVLAVRLGEYILIGYGLIYLSQLYSKWRARSATTATTSTST